MKKIKKSITHKAGFFIFSVFTLLAISIAIILRFTNEIATIPLFFISLIALFTLSFIFFVYHVSFPLHILSKEVHSLLSGKAYKRIRPRSIDEIGLITHFFNEITVNLEKISHDVRTGRALGEELQLAANIQQDVFPKQAPAVIGLDITARSKSARQIGGDSFDFLKKGNNLLLYVGDVTGHGIPAALIMMMVNTLMHMLSTSDLTPAEMLIKINTFLFEKVSSNRFMTLVLLRWDEAHQKMFYTGAGHETILIYRHKEKKVESIKSGGIALHMIPNIEKLTKEQAIENFEEEDSILLYSDGIAEAKNPETNEMYGLERLILSFERHGGLHSSQAIFERITEDFSRFAGNFVQDDDITVLVMKNKNLQGQAAPISISVPKSEKELAVIESNKQWDWD